MEAHHQTFEVFNLFNPAFCGAVIATVVESYQAESNKGFPYPVAYLLLPILLTKETRDTLPASVKQPMHAWIQNHPNIRIGFGPRCRDLLKISHDAITFLLQTKYLRMSNDSDLILLKPLKINKLTSEEVQHIMKKATLLGKWLANSGSPSTIFTMWGVRP